LKREDRAEASSELLRRLQDRSAVVGIVGLGYVGLPLALRFTEVGYPVLGFDIDAAKVDALNAGRSYIEHIPPASVAQARKRKFEATGKFARAAECDALIICVPTPLNKQREPDLSFVIGTVESLVPHLRAGQVMSLESTTYPGTTDEELKPRIESRGFKVGEDYYLCFSPEREDPGNPNFVTRTIPKICGGCTQACLQAGPGALRPGDRQGRFRELDPRRGNDQAAREHPPLGEHRPRQRDEDHLRSHGHRRARGDPRRGDQAVRLRALLAGPGSRRALHSDRSLLPHLEAREYGLHTRFIELAGEINRTMPEWVIGKVMEALNQRGKALKGSRVLVLGIAYKKDVDDMRESPAVELMELLVARGAKVEYSDPHVPVFPRMREHHFDLKSVALNAESIARYDLLLLATNHNAFDYGLVLQNAKLIVDTRGVYLDPAPNVVKA
jgi:UDP-N-acetyl-D-glucosamine dehydrogenase